MLTPRSICCVLVDGVSSDSTFVMLLFNLILGYWAERVWGWKYACNVIMTSILYKATQNVTKHLIILLYRWACVYDKMANVYMKLFLYCMYIRLVLWVSLSHTGIAIEEVWTEMGWGMCDQRSEGANSSPPSAAYLYASVKWVSIGSGNGLSSVRRQAITWNEVDLFAIGPSVKFEWKCKTFHSWKCIFKCRLRKWRPFCLGRDELTRWSLGSNANKIRFSIESYVRLI